MEVVEKNWYKELEDLDTFYTNVTALKLLVPILFNDFHYEVLACRVRRFVEGKVISPGFVIFLWFDGLLF